MEHIIEKLTDEEMQKLIDANTDIEWYLDDCVSSDICVYGTEYDAEEILKIIGREEK